MINFPYKHLSVLIMPTDYCNMNCVYCFNGRKTNTEKKVISLETLEKIFSITIPFYDELKFIWHGGEPTSMGLDFYKAAIEMQKKFNSKNVKITNSIQTNLTLLDEDFVHFLIDNDIKIGSSFDGTQNHLTRHNSDKILAGRDLVVKNGGRVGFICVVQSKNIDCLIEDYKWFKKKGINYTLNPYLSAPPYENDELFVSPKHYSKRICELFDFWAMDSECNITISYFNDFINFILFGEKSLCCYNSCLGKHVGIQYNGDIYNCNRDFPQECSYGNIYDYTDIRDCFASKGFENMLTASIERRKNCIESCDLYNFCNGGCCSAAFTGGNMAKANKHFCTIITSVYHYIENRLEEFKTKTPANNELAKKLEKYKARCSE